MDLNKKHVIDFIQDIEDCCVDENNLYNVDKLNNIKVMSDLGQSGSYCGGLLLYDLCYGGNGDKDCIEETAGELVGFIAMDLVDNGMASQFFYIATNQQESEIKVLKKAGFKRIYTTKNINSDVDAVYLYVLDMLNPTSFTKFKNLFNKFYKKRKKTKKSRTK